MPVNAGAEYFRAKDKYEKAGTDEERLECLQEMYQAAPKHKGSEVLLREITRKMGELRKKLERKKEQEKARKGKAPSMSVKKEGAGQIVLVGYPNTGKSTLMKYLTGADVEIAPYEFTTKKPQTAMMDYNGANIQIVDLPAVVEGSSKGKFQGLQVLSVVRNADAIVILVKNSNEFRVLLNELKSVGIKVIEKRPMIKVTQAKFGGINIVGKEFLSTDESEAKQFLKDLGCGNIDIILREKATLNQIVDVLDKKQANRRALLLCFDENTFNECKEIIREEKELIMKEKLRKEIMHEASEKLEKELREKIGKELDEWFENEKHKEMQKRIRQRMSGREIEKIEAIVVRELEKTREAKLQGLLMKEFNEKIDERVKKELEKKSLAEAEKEDTNIDVLLVKKDNLSELKDRIFDVLEIILVYTKKPGQAPDLKKPMVLKKGETVEDLARQLHKEFLERLKNVKVWGSTRFPGQRVSKDYELKNKDVVEIG